MKKFFIGFILGACLFGTGAVFAEEILKVVPNPFPVLINGVGAAVEGYNINGYTFLKLADFKQAGLTVKFNETDRQIEITNDTPASNENNTDVLPTASNIPAIPDKELPEGMEWVLYDYINYMDWAVKYNDNIYVNGLLLSNFGYKIKSDMSINPETKLIIDDVYITNGTERFEYDKFNPEHAIHVIGKYINITRLQN